VLDDLVTAHPVYINVAAHYIRPRHLIYARETFQAIVLELINADDCDLESDPCLVSVYVSMCVSDLTSAEDSSTAN